MFPVTSIQFFIGVAVGYWLKGSAASPHIDQVVTHVKKRGAEELNKIKDDFTASNKK